MMLWFSAVILHFSLVVFANGNTVGYEYSDYGAWTPCSRTCGNGYSHRTRRCLKGPCPPDGLVEKKDCNRGQCRIAGTVICTDCARILGVCAKVCHTNGQRPCRETPSKRCWMPRQEVVTCLPSDCLSGDGWTEYGEWRTCEQDCQQRRYRQCQGGDCVGDDHESRPCYGEECPTEYGPWGEWEGDCNTACFETRSRQCYKGDCSQEEERRQCTEGPCTLPLRWDEKAVGECNANCTQQWRLNCVQGPCLGQVKIETRPCDQDQCEPSDAWLPWSDWSDCVPTCTLRGFQGRTRQCGKADLTGCEGQARERRLCVPACPSSSEA